MDSNELTRIILNLVRKGKISAVDHDAKKCRVKSGELETNWIRWMTLRAGTTRTWNPPTIGEQVILLCPGGDPADGIALCAINDDDTPPPSDSPNKDVTAYPDGAVIEYDHAASALTATLPAGATVLLIAPASVTIKTDQATVQAQNVTIDAPQTTCTGKLTVQGRFTYLAGMSGKGGTGGGAAATIEGTVETTEDVIAGGKSLVNHVHQEQGDGAPTSKPL